MFKLHIKQEEDETILLIIKQILMILVYLTRGLHTYTINNIKHFC